MFDLTKVSIDIIVIPAFLLLVVMVTGFIVYPDLEGGVALFFLVVIAINFLLNLLWIYDNIRFSNLDVELKESLDESEASARILIRRDLELTEANARLQELDDIKSEFISVVGHQLRTPITGIKWSFDNLLEQEKGPINEDQQKVVKNGLAQTDLVIHFIDDLLNVARIEEGRFGFKFKKQTIIPVIEKIQNNFKNVASGKGVKLLIYLPSYAVPTVDIDEEKIYLVLNNVVDNAIKYTPAGGEATLTLSREDGSLRVTVKDTGIGIPRDQLHRMFTKFFRASNVIYETIGTGLGLYVAKNIIDKHHGTIMVESVEGKGTTISFTLPVSQNDQNSHS